jgi:hypothetical protein
VREPFAQGVLDLFHEYCLQLRQLYRSDFAVHEL